MTLIRIGLLYPSIHNSLIANKRIEVKLAPEGLQNKLNSLEKHCAYWDMKVNIKKTKIIIFNKASRTIKKKFLFAIQEVECISNYKYLGIHFTASGIFTIAKHELYKKH